MEADKIIMDAMPDRAHLTRRGPARWTAASMVASEAVAPSFCATAKAAAEVESKAALPIVGKTPPAMVHLDLALFVCPV